jgi:hypothetical protein
MSHKLDPKFRHTIQNLENHEEGIRNALIYSYSNGKIEAKNTHIKTLKRVSYGFKSYENMRTRIFLMNGLINIKSLVVQRLFRTKNLIYHYLNQKKSFILNQG